MTNTNEVTEMKDWAKREVELAKNEARADENAEALNGLYNIALNAYYDLVDKLDGVGRPGIVKAILMQLMREEPLTPIEDNDEDWLEVDIESEDPNVKPDFKIYQCKRRNSLFKKVVDDDEVYYSDSERAIGCDVNTNKHYGGGMGLAVLAEDDPIKMPYMPTGKIVMFTEDFKYDEDVEGDFDTVGVLYFRYPNGEMKKVMRFFKEDPETKKMVEIPQKEYNDRKKIALPEAKEVRS